jgi:CHAD domain-containing protein
MTKIPLRFELPENLTANKLLKKLAKKIEVQITSQQYTIKSFYDSFDWRLYNADLVCEFNHSQITSQLKLLNRKTGELLAQEKMQATPTFTEHFPSGHLKTRLEEKLEMRALLPICNLPYEAFSINVLNKDKKIVLCLQIDEHELLTNTVTLLPLKGYEKAAKNVSHLLQKTFGLKPSNNTILNSALKQQNRKPKDYSSKLAIKLQPKMRADEASKVIYRHLLQAMKVNEAGTIADTDSEFLHDFRVAVRRTRSSFSQIKNTLPAQIIAQHADFFAWLGQITGLTRDMDVYLLSYKDYQQALPLSLRDDIVPLYAFLKQKQITAQKELAKKLKSSEYIKQLMAWEQYLNQPLPEKTKENNATMHIKALADQRIWKIYNRLLKEAGEISKSSPAEALHDLRKTCKKLRYLMEFFQSLYPADKMKKLLKALKGFQTVLGDFQDYEVQELKMKQFSEEMMDNNIPSNTLLAMGVLVQYLDSMKCNARRDFAKQFTLFKQAENQAVFKKMFADKT